ncbi:MAG: Hint domain-containing protein, partial [Nanobdellota archaeon]
MGNLKSIVFVFILFSIMMFFSGSVIAPDAITQDDEVQECFVSGTLISTPDGLKPIEDIQVGDEVIGKSGVNMVTSLYHVILGDQPLYSINDDDAFVTKPHPFLSTEGWKAIDPVAAKHWNPDLEMTKLEVGDVLITDAGHEIVSSITAHPASFDTPIFNFAVSGDKTYFADGYLVHNKDCTTGEFSCVADDCMSCNTVTGNCEYDCDSSEVCSPTGNCVECTLDVDCGGACESCSLNECVSDCTANQYCLVSSDVCVSCDNDGDGYESGSCGGSDCLDSDDSVYPPGGKKAAGIR